MHSIVARWLGLSPPVHSGRSAVRGLAVFSQGHGMKHEVHQLVGDGRRVAFVPLNDKDIFWGLTFTSPAKGSTYVHHHLNFHFSIQDNNK